MTTKAERKEQLHSQGLRECSRCREIKAETEFHRSKRDRFGLTSRCKVCNRTANSKWQKENLWSARQRGAKYRRDPEVRKAAVARGLRWQQENPEAAKAAYNRWVANKPDDVARHRREGAGRRRARVRRNPVFQVSAKDQRRLAQSPCYHCGAQGEHIDHVIPVALGGSHGIGNLRSMCKSCNLSKNSKLYAEFRYIDNRKAR